MSKNAEAVRIQDDLYHAVNDEWIKNAVIPADKPATGGFMTLDEDVEKLLMADFAAFEKGEQTPDIKILEDAVRLYRKAMDTDARSEAGMKPLHPLLEKIKGIDSPAKFNEQSAELLEDCVIFPFEINVQEDWKDTTRHSFCIDDPQLLLFDPSYYDKPIVFRTDQAIHHHFLFSLYPTIAPTIPPKTCDRLEMLSCRNSPSYTCCPKKTIVTRINVSGISPFLKLVNDVKRINDWGIKGDFKFFHILFIILIFTLL